MTGRFAKLFSTEAWSGLKRRWKADREATSVTGALVLTSIHALNFAGRAIGFLPAWPRVRVRCRSALHPVTIRVFGSDIYVFRQVLIDREHECVSRLADVECVVDCGANVGYAAAYLLTSYPLATLIAVEPDDRNFEILEKNLVPYGRRAQCVKAAIWDAKDRSIAVSRGTYRDGLDWSATVSEAIGGDVRSVTIDEMLSRSPRGQIDVLKIDIEGSEARLFGNECHSWLGKTRNLCIELHGPECERALEAALVDYRFRRDISDELTVLLDLAPRSSVSGDYR